MKIIGLVLLAVLLSRGTMRAESLNNELGGALVGGAIGAVVANQSSDIRSEVAIPVGALIGGLLAHGADRGWYGRRSDYYADDYSRPYPYGGRYPDRWEDDPYHGRYQDRWEDDPWHGSYYPRRHASRAPYRYANPRHYRERPQYYEQQPAPKARGSSRKGMVAAQPEADLQPGVSIVKIPITLQNGTTVDIRLLRLADRFVGPRGEVYATLPTPGELGERYTLSGE